MITARQIYFSSLFLFLFVSSNNANERAKIDSLIALPYNVVYDAPRKWIPIFTKAIEESNELNYNFGSGRLYSQLATAYIAQSEYDNFRKAEISAIKLFEEINNEKELLREYGIFGYHLRRTNLERSKYYMRLAIKLGEELTSDELRGIYDNYGVVLEFANEIDSSRYFFEKALKLKYAVNDSIGIPYGLNHLAESYALTGNMDKAFTYLAKSDKYRAKEKSNYGRAENNALYGDFYKMIGKYDLAINRFTESLKLALLIGNKHMVQYNYEKLSEIYQKKGDYKKALVNLKSHKIYQDSILNSETSEKIAELEIKFESEKKDKEITVSKFRLKKQRFQIIFISSISIILLVVSIGIYRFQKYKRKKIKTELELKNKLSKAEYENRINDEKLRISRELHDNIGSHLTFMVSSIDNLTYGSKDEKHISKLNKLSNFGRNTLNELRHTIWAMKHSESTLEQLELKLNLFKKQILSNTKIILVNNVKSQIILSSTQTLNLYRVVQEAIQNAIKYADASKIEIVFAEIDNGIQLSIKDDGKGFDISTAQMGNGISNMKFRCKEADAIFSILSNNAGTEILCNLKLK